MTFKSRFRNRVNLVRFLSSLNVCLVSFFIGIFFLFPIHTIAEPSIQGEYWITSYQYKNEPTFSHQCLLGTEGWQNIPLRQTTEEAPLRSKSELAIGFSAILEIDMVNNL